MSENSFPLKPSTTQILCFEYQMNLKVVMVFQKVPATEMVVRDIPSQLQVSLIGESELTSAAVVQQSYLDSEPC